jgi:hypothetical protein
LERLTEELLAVSEPEDPPASTDALGDRGERGQGLSAAGRKHDERGPIALPVASPDRVEGFDLVVAKLDHESPQNPS